MTTTVLRDRFGRIHQNLRVSVTDRCNLRCFYCMPLENVQYLPRPELLTYEELIRVIDCLVRRCGVNKVRITGGEPLVRKDLPEFVRQVVSVPGLQDVALTTNGILLENVAEELYSAGLRRLNISLDTLDRDRFQQIARRDLLDRVLTGIQIAQSVGFHPIKINAVAIRGLTEADLVPLAQLARETGIEVRFIEYMPLDADRLWEREKVLFAETIREILASQMMPLQQRSQSQGPMPAQSYEFEDGIGRIGFIASVSQPFCANCNRFRLTADGKIRNCLFSQAETDLRELLRGGASEEELIARVLESIQAKNAGHEINSAQFLQPLRPMHSIGG